MWATQKLINQDDSWSVTIPKGIKAGQYLLRLDLLALQDTGYPQFHPSCIYMNIASSGSSVPSASDLVVLPRIYADAGETIYGDVWDGPVTTWPTAGSAVVAWAKHTTTAAAVEADDMFLPDPASSPIPNPSTRPTLPLPLTHPRNQWALVQKPPQSAAAAPVRTTRGKSAGEKDSERWTLRGRSVKRSYPIDIASLRGTHDE